MNIHKFDNTPIRIPKDNPDGRMKAFMQLVGNKYNIQFHDYWQFHKWSVTNVSEFWSELWDFMGIISSKKGDKVIDLSIPLENCPKWFEGSRLNYAENMLRYRDDRLALVVTGENRAIQNVTYRQLYEETRLYAAALRKLGIKKGDIVSCFMTNRKESIIAMLATTSIGAIWVGSITALRSKGFLSGMKSLQPRILFTVDQYSFNKKVVDLLEEIQKIEEGLPCLEKIIIVPSNQKSTWKDISGIKKGCFLEDFLQTGHNADGSVPELEFEQMSLSDPIFIVHTSGTTGAPKPIVHGSGVLLTRLRDYCLHWNVQRDDVWLTLTPPGWSSWNGFTMLLFHGATLVVFEGSPSYLCTYVWDLIGELKITTLTMTANLLDEVEARRYLPTEKHDLSSLKMILGFGNIVMPQTFDFVLKKVKKDVTFAVMYACTEIISSFAVTELTLPLHRGEISSISLGVAADILDEEGNAVIGQEGEFVLIKSIPSFPLGFWNDTNGQSFKEHYLSKYPGKFTLGDAAIMNPDTHGIRILGRCNEILKPNEIFFRSYHIYHAIDGLSEIQDSLCVAHYLKDIDQRVVLFVKMQEGHSFNRKIVQMIQKAIEQKLSEKHVPEVIIDVPDIPYNVNGKKMESLVRRIINNVPNITGMVSNPDCLKYFYNNPQLCNYKRHETKDCNDQ